MKKETLAKVLKLFPIEIGYREVRFPVEYLRRLVKGEKLNGNLCED